MGGRGDDGVKTNGKGKTKEAAKTESRLRESLRLWLGLGLLLQLLVGTTTATSLAFGWAACATMACQKSPDNSSLTLRRSPPPLVCSVDKPVTDYGREEECLNHLLDILCNSFNANAEPGELEQRRGLLLGQASLVHFQLGLLVAPILCACHAMVSLVLLGVRRRFPKQVGMAECCLWLGCAVVQLLMGMVEYEVFSPGYGLEASLCHLLQLYEAGRECELGREEIRGWEWAEMLGVTGAVMALGSASGWFSLSQRPAGIPIREAASEPTPPRREENWSTIKNRGFLLRSPPLHLSATNSTSSTQASLPTLTTPQSTPHPSISHLSTPSSSFSEPSVKSKGTTYGYLYHQQTHTLQ